MMVFSAIMQGADQKGGKKKHLGTHELKGNRALDQTGPYRVASYKLILHERKVAESG